VKGGSEAGNIAAPPAIVNAIIDALVSLGVHDLPLPVRAEHVWRAINSSASTGTLAEEAPGGIDAARFDAEGVLAKIP
jgi:carbon-monoxide dehydrogenase large subunit